MDDLRCVYLQAIYPWGETPRAVRVDSNASEKLETKFAGGFYRLLTGQCVGYFPFVVISRVGSKQAAPLNTAPAQLPS